MNKKFCYILLCLCCVLFSCKHTPIEDATLTFSQDTVRFDTIFSNIGTSTHIIKVRNLTKEDIIINTIELEGAPCFKVNIDGEVNLNNLAGTTLQANDSLQIFLKAYQPEQGNNLPLFIEGKIKFILEKCTQQVVLQAYSQDVEVLRDFHITQDTTLHGAKPYLVYGNLVVDTGITLNIDAGSTFYMHDKAALICYGTMRAIGETERHITFQGDRLDFLFPNIPYKYVSGQWDGIYLLQPANMPHASHALQYVETQSGRVGLFLQNNNPSDLIELTLDQCVIHNFAQYGIVLQNCNANISNTEISNCANYCVYMAGGTHSFTYSTIASFFDQSYYIIQNTPYEDMAAVYINNLSKEFAQTDAHFKNCVISGKRSNNIVIATPFADSYKGTFSHCYIKADSTLCQGLNNVYFHDKDTIFRNTFFDKEYHYYDFRLDSASRACGIANPDENTHFPIDRMGITRPTSKPNPGCYQ